ncbi:MAG: bifunctional 3,4-dihydroxy-2-butanone-4-phosphate synthase/GTP cyclohydrolase II [Chloroflexi bacterium]|nr:bifunctional 3,4-dihydroxy-2-butanone-4-phosphate synthase/GTP cyclohydrolase II [Chloroflexota bacterium]
MREREETTEESVFAPITDAIEDFRQGKFIIIVDDADRENEGDLTIAADHVSAEAINFMATHGRGLVCVPIIGARLDELEIPMMVQENTSGFGTAFTVAVDARRGVSTGISAADRAETIKALLDPATRPSDLSRPGHVFPLRYKEGGVLRRTGQTEASVDMARLAGLYPAAVICEIMNPDGTMARQADLRQFSLAHGVKIISVASLIEYRRRTEKLVHKIAQTSIPTDYGVWDLHVYESDIDDKHHVALVQGDISSDPPPLVRAHSECLTGDVFGSHRCDCGEQLHEAMRLIQEEQRGVILYMRQEGRGIGLVNKMLAYELQDAGMDTVEANEHLGFAPDLRDYGLGAQILADLGVTKMRLLTNNLAKRVGLEAFGLDVVERVPLVTVPNETNLRYLQAKQNKLGHLLGLDG